MITWADIDLCLDKDLLRYETDALAWFQGRGAGKSWRSTAKDEIAKRLRSTDFFRKLELDPTITADSVLDLISNPEELRDAAVFLTLHLIANDKSAAPGDLYDRKAEIYYHRFTEELKIAIPLLSVLVGRLTGDAQQAMAHRSAARAAADERPSLGLRARTPWWLSGL